SWPPRGDQRRSRAGFCRSIRDWGPCWRHRCSCRRTGADLHHGTRPTGDSGCRRSSSGTCPAHQRHDAPGWGNVGDGTAQATAEDGEQTLMRWLASRDSIYQAVGAPWPTPLPIDQWAWLYDGLAARKVEHTSNLLSILIAWSGPRRVNLVGLAGYEVDRPLTTATVEVRVGSVWQSPQTLVIDGTTAALALALGDITGVRLTLNTGVSGTVHRVGEVLLGDALELPEPST